MAATTERFLHCTPADVFAVLADGWSYAGWVVGATRVRSVSPDWPAVGSHIDHSVGLWPAVLNDRTTVTACEPGTRLELRARAWPAGEAVVVLEIAEADDGCTVRMHEDSVTGPGHLIPPPVRHAALRPRNVETLRRLAHLAEGRGHPG